MIFFQSSPAFSARRIAKVDIIFDFAKIISKIFKNIFEDRVRDLCYLESEINGTASPPEYVGSLPSHFSIAYCSTSSLLREADTTLL